MDTDVLTATDETELLPSVGDHLEDRAAELCQLMIEKERLREEDLQRAQAYRELAQDRKSTRLNSSHVANSYAVFCLKKKKKCTLKDGTHCTRTINNAT